MFDYLSSNTRSALDDALANFYDSGSLTNADSSAVGGDREWGLAPNRLLGPIPLYKCCSAPRSSFSSVVMNCSETFTASIGRGSFAVCTTAVKLRNSSTEP